MGYPCPYKGTPQGIKVCERDAETVRGWKGHMSRNHKEWTQEQLQTALGATAVDSERGRELFLSEVDGVTDGPPASSAATGEGKEEARPSQSQPSSEKVREIKTDATARKLSAKFDKFQKKVTERLTQALSNAVKEKGPEWEMTQEDRELFSESIENCFEVLDIKFNIAPIAVELTNPLWVLLLPALVLLLIFVPKAVKLKIAEGGTHVEPVQDAPSAEKVASD
jgi:hypothetical protein